jgi:hypothetical protein
MSKAIHRDREQRGGEGMIVIPEGPDAPPMRLQPADPLSAAGFPFSKATLATTATRSSAQSRRPVRSVSEAGVTSKVTIRVTAGDCGIVEVVVLTGIKGPF